MSEETKKLFEETVENLRYLDESSIRIIKSGAEMLKAKCELDRECDEKEAG